MTLLDKITAIIEDKRHNKWAESGEIAQQVINLVDNVKPDYRVKIMRSYDLYATNKFLATLDPAEFVSSNSHSFQDSAGACIEYIITYKEPVV